MPCIADAIPASSAAAAAAPTAPAIAADFPDCEVAASLIAIELPAIEAPRVDPPLRFIAFRRCFASSALVCVLLY